MLENKELSTESLTIRITPSLKAKIIEVANLYQKRGYNKAEIARVALEQGLAKLEQDYKTVVILEAAQKTKKGGNK